MPFYTYINPESEETIEIVQSVHDDHVYIDDKGLQWQRVFTAPEVNTHGTLKAECSDKQFSEHTKNRKGSIGDLWDQSAELSEKRKKDLWWKRSSREKNILKTGLKKEKVRYTLKVVQSKLFITFHNFSFFIIKKDVI